MPLVETAGTRLHYWELGTGPVALFVHGFPLDATMWLDQMERLAGERHCVAVDLRGFGRSDPITTDVLTMERHADDLAELVVRLGVDAVDLVGLSMGGYVTLAMAQLHPGMIRTLALVDTRAAADDQEGRAGRDEAKRRVLEKGRRDLADRMSAALLGPGATETVRARLRTMIESIRYETVVAALEGMKRRPDRSGILGRMEAQVAVVVGEQDTVTPPEEAAAMAEAIPHATLHRIPGAGHLSPMEAPDEVATALRSLFSHV